MMFLVVTQPSIYHGCSTRKTFWEEKFAGKKQDLFEPVNMRNCGKLNFRKHREIKKGDERVTYENKYEILKFSEKFGILDIMETAFLIPPFFPLTLMMWFPSYPECQIFLRFSKSDTCSHR